LRYGVRAANEKAPANRSNPASCHQAYNRWKKGGKRHADSVRCRKPRGVPPSFRANARPGFHAPTLKAQRAGKAKLKQRRRKESPAAAEMSHGGNIHKKGLQEDVSNRKPAAETRRRMNIQREGRA